MNNSIELLQSTGKETKMEMATLRLTPRGKEVFELILCGLTITQIAERLGIGYSGVLRHREKMLL